MERQESTNNEYVKELETRIALSGEEYLEIPVENGKGLLDIIKRLTEENRLLSKEWDNTTRYCAELQKQVDELKKSQVVHISIDDKLQKEYEYEIKQAVKDTAKEILDEVSKHYGGAWLVELYKRYGVEVE